MQIEYWQSRKDGKWYFHVKARNGKLLASSQGYKRKLGATKGIEALVGNIRYAPSLPVGIEIKQ